MVHGSTRSSVMQALRHDLNGLTAPEAGTNAQPTVVIEPSQGLLELDLRSVWEYRELLYFLIWRDVRVRYKQTAIGAAWAVLQPLVTMLIFVVIFGVFAKFPSAGLPYPIFAYVAIALWYCFSQAATTAAQSLVGEAAVLKKVFFPRLLIPIAAVIRPVLDFAVSFVLLLALMIWYGITPKWTMLAVPLFVLYVVITALAVGLWLSALNVRYRDVGHTFPFLIQIWMFASPVAYSVSLVPDRWRVVYSLNPLVGAIEGLRWAALGTPPPALAVTVVSALIVFVVLIGGLIFFTRMEQTFADVV